MGIRTYSLVASLAALAAMGVPVTGADALQRSPPQNPNPTGDPDVQAGYDRTTREILDKRAQEGTNNSTPSASDDSDRSEHDHGHTGCPDGSVCSNQSTYKNDPNTPPQSF